MRNRPVLAGVVLALAVTGTATAKIPPAYQELDRRKRALSARHRQDRRERSHRR
jgi:hypothetical protein